MRESRTFAERTRVRGTDEVRKKYFLVFEGSDTELMYFRAVEQKKGEIGISPLIELVPILRSYSEEGWSNPKKILDRVIENLEESRTKHISFETLLNRMMDYFYEEKILTTNRFLARSVWKTMRSVCEEKLHRTLISDVDDVEEACCLLLETLREEYDIVNLVSDISDMIREGGITYDEEFDKIALVADRDRDSFVAEPGNNQYVYVLEKCREKAFGFYVTNPCFEFWLLLHFDEVFELDREKLLENPRVTAKRRYAEQELRKIWPGYEKSAYEAGELVRHVDRAIENEKHFCEDADELEDQVGSNVGLLIKELKGIESTPAPGESR